MSFADEIKAFAKKAQENSERVIIGVRSGLSESIINKTPLDTGLARGNWQASIGSPETIVIDRLDGESGYAPTSGEGKSLYEANNVAVTELDKDFYLVNNVDYIHNLEYGGSNQSPNGMVRITVLDFQNIVNDVVKGLD